MFKGRGVVKMPSFKPEKLRVNLRLSINRLKLLEKKKTEEALKARREIADYIKNKRIERARIRVEHIIREDYLVEAMEVIELYCDLLLARFGMLEQMMYCEDSLVESVSTLIWVAPRLSADVQELNTVSKQLEFKFGKQFADQARSNMSGTVNAKVIHRLGAEAPKKTLVENYMVEIARNYKVEYSPDPTMFLDEDDLPPPPPSGGQGGKGYIPEQQAGPLPTKEDPGRYVHMPSGGYANGQPPAHPQGVANLPPAYPGPPSQPPPPSNPNHLPYPTGPQSGVQAPALPPTGDGLDLPPVPQTQLPHTGGASGGGDVDFDDLTRRFEELKRRK